MNAFYQHVPSRTEQAEADAYWSTRDRKKWVVTLTCGAGKKAKSCVVYVGAINLDRARVSGRYAAHMMGHKWARTCNAQVRLATYRDLGADRTC